MRRLMSRFPRPEDEAVIKSVQETLRRLGLTPVTDQALIDRIQSVRNSVESIREADEAMRRDG